jgi:serine/threonine-protein kinase
MAPEQASGRIDRIAPATDVFALAVILLEMWTGTAFPEAETPWWMIVMRGDGAVRAKLDAVASSVPLAIRDVIARGLAGEPASRPRDAAELALALGAATASSVGRSEVFGPTVAAVPLAPGSPAYDAIDPRGPTLAAAAHPVAGREEAGAPSMLRTFAVAAGFLVALLLLYAVLVLIGK